MLKILKEKLLKNKKKLQEAADTLRREDYISYYLRIRLVFIYGVSDFLNSGDLLSKDTSDYLERVFPDLVKHAHEEAVKGFVSAHKEYLDASLQVKNMLDTYDYSDTNKVWEIPSGKFNELIDLASLVITLGLPFDNYANNPLIKSCIEIKENKIEKKSKEMDRKQSDLSASEFLALCKLEGKKLVVPKANTFYYSGYSTFKKLVLSIGGSYATKENSFYFPFNPQKIIERICSGENINLIKDYQFYPTPDEVISLMLDDESFEGKEVLEPSCGRGAIVTALQDRGAIVTAIELMPENCEILTDLGIDHIQADFLTHSFERQFDYVVANPPFAKGQDIAHVTKMLGLLKDGGKLISVMSNSWRLKEDKKSKAFRNLLNNNYEIIELESGSFASSGTQVASCIIKIQKG